MSTRRMIRWLPGVVCSTLFAAACAGGGFEVPAPRPLVMPSGDRLYADSTHVDSVDVWVRRANETIRDDPSFWLSVGTAPEERLPWETYRFIEPDTVSVSLEPRAPDAALSYQVYAFLRLMHRWERMDDWFPEATPLEGYDLERFLVEKTADSWLLGRAVYDLQPYAPMDELIWTIESGYLDEYVLVSHGDRFEDERASFERENPGGLERYSAWFEEVFNRPPPGRRRGGREP